MNDDPLRAATFHNHPDPMWVYDTESLKFLEVNEAAILKYGYSRQKFLTMTLEDIRPAEEIPALRKNVRSVTAGFDHAGVWRHRLKSGKEIHVDIVSHTIDWQGLKAELVCARDVSPLVGLERKNRLLLKIEQRLRREAEQARWQIQQVFRAVPSKILVLDPANYRIVAVSDAYLAATMTRRDGIIGRNFFEIFPDDPDQPPADSTRNLRRSLQRVRKEGISHVMGVQRHPIPRPSSRGGGFEERYWSTVNSPVKNSRGDILFIIHRVEDVTRLFRSKAPAHERILADLENPEAQPELDVLLRSQELADANDALREQQANLRTAQRLLNLGIWKLDPESRVLTW
ncbi:MAG: PAS domain S-box protein, partial [Xanthomonadales bacterium]|nr:PAS domain S-box protein [Xanthomonadales bacterium]